MSITTSPSEFSERARETSLGVKLGYSVGNLGKNIVWTSFDIFLLYYLVRVASFSPLVAGGALTAAMLWDGCGDIAVAYWADRYGRPNALGRLILLGAPLCGASFWLIFIISPDDGRPLILAAVMLCRIGYSLCDIGHNTLLVRIATTGHAAATVSGIRLLFSAIGAGLVGTAATAIFAIDPRYQRAAFATAAMIGGAIYLVTLVIAFCATRQLSVRPNERPPLRVAAIFGALWRNRMYRRVLCLIAIQVGLIPMFNHALPFVGEATHGGAGWAGLALTVITLAQALSLPAWVMLTRWHSPGIVLALAYGAAMVAFIILAQQSGGTTGLVGLSLLGITQGGMNMAIWALLAVSIRNGAADGIGNEALPVGFFLAVLKAGAGIGNGLFAASVATSDRWCTLCSGHDAGPILFAATVVPIIGCVAGLFLIVGNGRLLLGDVVKPTW